MITSFEASLQQLSVHYVGNKLSEGPCVLSDKPLSPNDELLKRLLMQYFLSPFEKMNEVYRFTHSSGNLALNELFHFSASVFDDPGSFHEISRQVASHLFNVSAHPNIKEGEVYAALFSDVQLEGALYQVFGIFKSETRETYLKVNPEGGGFKLEYEQAAININKLDKGCLVFCTEKEEGYRVLVLDQTNRSTGALYWKDDFLQLKIRNDDYNKTNNALSVYKDFVTKKLDDEFEISKADKIDLLNKSMKYFKEKETFSMDEFADEVIGNEQAAASFKNYARQYGEEFDAPLEDTFAISAGAVKKQGRVYKSVLKLDKNFHIYIHGNKDLIEKGFDDDKAMNYYKVYFKDEQ